MQRKMKLICKLMAYVEACNKESSLPVPELAEYSEAETHYHVGLCQEAGYMMVGSVDYSPDGRRRFSSIERLTWAGHECP